MAKNIFIFEQKRGMSLLELLEIFQSPWAFRALIASSMVGVMCGTLGAFIVLRNMSLIGDALAHAILPGIVIAFILVGHNSLGFFIGAVMAGLFTAFVITWIQKKVNTKNDAAIGITFTAMFAIGVVGISRISKQDGVHLDLKDFLFGNVLGVSDADLYLTAIVGIVVVTSIIIFYRYLFITTFQPVVAATMGIKVDLIHYLLMLLLSFAVVASLRTVGVILVVAMLITPAATALLLSNRLQIVILLSAIIGLISSILGLVFAIIFETTPGPAMAITVTGFYLLAVLLSPERGLIFKYFRTRKEKERISLEDVIKESFKLQTKGKLNWQNLGEKLHWTDAQVKRVWSKISYQGLTKKGETLSLNAEGIKRANALIRAHRLWETFLVNEIGLNEGQIHEDAENFEHYLTEEMLDEVDAHLGYPAVDPHGSPIPEDFRKLNVVLWNNKSDNDIIISERQGNTQVIRRLWELGLMPGENISIINRSSKNMTILSEEKEEISLPQELCEQIYTVATLT